MTEAASVVVVGAGLAGMSVAIGYGTGAVVLERDARPGGLVRTELKEGFWFDRVLHLLHFQDPAAEFQLQSAVSTPLHMEAMPPDARVVTPKGKVPFPIQHNLGQLDPDAAVACLIGLFEVRDAKPGHDYASVLRACFGEPLFELFFGPYNRKQWGTPLTRLAADRVLWNLHRPSLADALRAAIRPSEKTRVYNQRAVYPRPPANASLRGMEVLSCAMAGAVPDLRLAHEVRRLDPDTRIVRVRTAQAETDWRWEGALVSTAPLPDILGMCLDLPKELRDVRLPWNGVSSVALRVRGRRPDAGAWRYFPEPDVVFTRLVFLHVFDPKLAPPHGWPLLAEVVWRGEDGPPEPEALIKRVIADAERVGALAGGEVEGADVIVAAPAYVRFEHGVDELVKGALSWLQARGIHPCGRYGRWEYSSMQHAVSEGLALGRALRASR